MFIKKIDGPRAVTLPDGTIMTRADPPPRDTRRWVASRKAAVVRAVRGGLITIDEARKWYEISNEEFESWATAVMTHGEAALKTTRLQQFRTPPK
ncbi:DUF1153 domain-containing protein [Tropicimonas sp. IMCC6043]|uniref:CtrA inhibitor SciP n=1 Tax=Tropicimonas sp. IMCC6043 TaxID=2510645 RepID=UPI00101C0EF7|nr:DUF1153 domain-containing protein [Tropicimonas sp. IMCC6043]RYH10334.1 DUF1153 domain-containing protein [Tropicimonas sp. IMCC6043]